MSEKKYTFCRVCEAACGLIVEVEDNRIRSILPNKEHISSRGAACPKGLLFHEIEHSPDRLRHPLKRVDNEFVEISWDTALKEIGGKVRGLIERYGPDAVSLYAGNGAGFCFLHTIFAQAFIEGVGSKNVFSSATQDCSNKFAVAQEMYGFPMTQPVPDLDNINCLYILGANPVVTKFSFKGVPDTAGKLKEAEKRGARIVSINPRVTETAKTVGEHIFIRPGTDLFFLLSFAREVIAAGGICRDRVDRFMEGYDHFAEIVEPWPPELTEKVTRIPAEQLRDLVRTYVEAEGAVLYCSTGINQSRTGSLSFWILESINAVTGNLDRKGGTVVGKGIVDFPRLTRRSGTMMTKRFSRIGECPALVDSFPGGILADEILTPGDGQVKALFVTAGNPLLSMPESGKMEQALKELELLVMVDIFRNATAEHAHYILPATTFLQHPDFNFLFQSLMGITNFPFLTYSEAVLEPEGEQKEEMWIFRELAKACGIHLFGSPMVTFLLAVEEKLSSLPVIGKLFALTSKRIFNILMVGTGTSSVRKMKKNPSGIYLKPFKPGSFLGKRVFTKSGRVNLGPARLLEASKSIEDLFKEEMGSREQMKMVNMRQLLTHNSYFNNGPTFFKRLGGGNVLYIHPADAETLELRADDRAEVRTEHGSIVLSVVVTEDIMEKTVAIPWGWGQQGAGGLSVASGENGANVNILTGSGLKHIDRVSGMAHLTAVPVAVRKSTS